MPSTPESVISGARKTHGFAEVGKCEESGCTLRLDGLGARLVLKGEQLRPQETMCDYVVLTAHDGSLCVSAVELKSKTVHTSEVQRKLANGAEVAATIIGDEPRSCCRLHLLLLHKGLHASELRQLQRILVPVGDGRRSIRTKHCGVSLRSVLSER